MPNVPLNSDEELGATISHIYDVEFYDQDIDLNIDFALTPSDAALALILAIALLAALKYGVAITSFLMALLASPVAQRLMG